ncbi:MAG: DUF3783 domain-containing protein [Clostridium sp.]|uniref:DUF3783 domain-containing protein n=1 Tax=Clostridium sp. TaxID=1506 RepID=UPI00291265B2|nr:DUF3783 domain-containing protein [Clostridium sp.]MDU7338669.1 DUF3783 domain-containing protein [Clostridium sp.]
MKARVAQEVVLLYHLPEDTELGKNAVEAFRRAGIPYRHVTQEQLGESVGALVTASLEGKRYEGEIPERGAMVFAGFTSNRLDQVLNRLHSVDPRNQAMKAVVTETNRTWAFGELLSELSREREAIRRQLQEQQEKAKAELEQIPQE